ncbi:MAG: DUF835 domain-containing protein [Candidatus Altiarchaeota archaeon]
MASINSILPELLLNSVGIFFSLVALYYWIKLYKRIYRRRNEFQGWVWLSASAFAILLLNISSTYMLFAKADVLFSFPANDVLVNFNTLQVIEVLSRTIIVFSMTVGVYLIYSPLKSGFSYTLVPTGLGEPAPEKEKPKYSIEACMSYLIPEKTSTEIKDGYTVVEVPSSNSMKVFSDLASHGIYGLIITRDYPVHVRKNWDVDNLPVIWLTTSKEMESISNVQCIDPMDLVGLAHAIKNFIKTTENSVVLLDGVEYLITQNSFNEILKLIQSINDFVSQNKTRLIVPLDYQALGEKELHLLKRELCELRVV